MKFHVFELPIELLQVFISLLLSIHTLIAQLEEHCTGIAEVRVWIPFGPKIFRKMA